MWPIGTRSSVLARIEPGPHRPRDAAVQRRHRVGAVRQLQRQHRHAERLVSSCCGSTPAEGQQRLAVEAHRLAQRSEMLLDEIRREAIVAGRHGRVRGEEDVRGDHAQRLVRRQALALHPLPRRTRAPRRRCGLRSGGRRPACSRAPAAPARRRRRAAAPGGCGPARRRHRAARSARDPRAGCLRHPSRAAAACCARPSRVQTRAEIVPVRVSTLTVTVRPSFVVAGRIGSVAASTSRYSSCWHISSIEALPEVALVVVEADADQRDAEVGGRLDVIAGQDAEAARVDRQRLVQPELGREVGDRPRPQHAGVALAPGVARRRGIPRGGGRRS